MMKEIEVKILEINKKNIEKQLISFGAKKIFSGPVTTVFFDFPDQRITKNKDLLRLRKKGSKSLLTYKQAVNDASMKIMNESEVEISDFCIMQDILEKLGFQKKLTIQKRRVSYKYKNVTCEIDTHTHEYSFIPSFLEIEAETKKRVYECAKQLGFKKQDCKPWNFYDVAQYYKKKQVY